MTDSTLKPAGEPGAEMPMSGFVRQPAGWRRRARAALIHMAIGGVVIAAVLAVVFLFWYKQPLATAAGVGPIVGLLLLVDLLLGPLLTFAVFNPAKKSLKADLTVIACIQVAALAYGLHALDSGRPAWLVFVKDRFELIAKADLRPQDLNDASANPYAQTSLFGPRIIASVAPENPAAYRDALMEAVTGGRDLQHRPDFFEDYAGQADEAIRKARPIDELRKLDPQHLDAIDAGVARTGLGEAQLAYLPVRGPSADLAMLIDRRDGKPLLLVNARPWR